jgi:subtilisin
MPPIYRLPPDWRLTRVTTPLSETLDWSLKFLGIPPLWQQSRGQGVRVAVLDTGCDLQHPDLRGAIVDSRDFTRSPWGVADRQGHGTWCCGMIAARAGNNMGVGGIAPECELLVGKVLRDNGTGDDREIEAGLTWALDNEADIVSMSFGGTFASRRMRGLLAQMMKAGILLIAAAGNDGPGSPPNYPGAWPETISVAAVGRDGRVTDFSSRGPTVDIAAPGEDMLSTIPGGYALNSGTSMACPVVAGVAALCLAKHRQRGGNTPVETVDDFRAHLQATAIDQGQPGRDEEYGFGLISPEALLARQEREPTPPPEGGTPTRPPEGGTPTAPPAPGPIAGGLWIWHPGARVA